MHSSLNKKAKKGIDNLLDKAKRPIRKSQSGTDRGNKAFDNWYGQFKNRTAGMSDEKINRYADDERAQIKRDRRHIID